MATVLGELIRASAEVLAFCDREDIVDSAEKALEFTRKYFPHSDLHLELSSDPEGTGEWLVVRFDVPGEVDKVLDAYTDLKREWLASVPFEKRLLIRFVYNII